MVGCVACQRIMREPKYANSHGLSVSRDTLELTNLSSASNERNDLKLVLLVDLAGSVDIRSSRTLQVPNKNLPHNKHPPIILMISFWLKYRESKANN